MALATTSAIWQQVNSPALDIRRFLSIGNTEGVVGATDMTVAQRAAGANMSVDIAAGEALVLGDTVTNQGLYYAYNDAVTNLATFAAANATNPRVDRVTLRVRDAFHGDAANDLAFQVVTGTATAGATLTNLTGAAAVPASSLLLANVLIPATATTVTTGNIDTTLGSVRPFFNASRSPWTLYTPTWSASGTAPALGNGSLAGRYITIGKTVHFRFSLVAGSTTTFGTGSWAFSLPIAATTAWTNFPPGDAMFVDASPANTYVGAMRVEAGGTTVTFWTNASPAAIVGPAAPITWASGDALYASGTYETT